MIGLIIASVGAILAFWKGGLPYGFTQPKLVLIVIGLAIAWASLIGRKMDRRLMIAAGIYSAAMIISFMFTKDVPLSVVGFRGIYSGSMLTGCLCIVGLLLASTLDERESKTVEQSILAAGSIAAVYAVVQYFSVADVHGGDPWMFVLPTGGRATSTSGSPVDLGAMMVALMTVCPHPLWTIAILASGSKAAMAGALVAVTPKRFRVWSAVAFSVLMVAFVMRSSDRKEQMRMQTWGAALHGLTPRTILVGTGPATFVYKSVEDMLAHTGQEWKQVQAHNAFLEAFSSSGIVGLFGMLAFLVAPEMAGLWVIGMVDPISFEIVFLACVMVGMARREDAIQVSPMRE